MVSSSIFNRKPKHVFALIFSILVLLLFDSATATGQGKKSDERLLKNRSLTQLKANLEQAQKDGFAPVDAMVSLKGKRASFDLRLVKPESELKWVAKTELTDEEFWDFFEKSKARQFRLICHQEYEVKGKTKHLCIWHFDPTYEANKSLGKVGTAPHPIIPLKPTWNSTSTIPITGKPVRQFAAVDQLMEDFLRTSQVPGISIAVTVHGKLIYARGFGYSNIEAKSALRPDQPMRLFQACRPITSAAVMQLVEAKKFNLNTPVFEFLGLTIPVDADPNLKNITIDHLLHDTAGFDRKAPCDPIRNPELVARQLKTKDFPLSKQTILEFMMTQPLKFEPGSKRNESNFGYFLLGRVIEKASGLSYEDYVKRIFSNLFGSSRFR